MSEDTVVIPVSETLSNAGMPVADDGIVNLFDQVFEPVGAIDTETLYSIVCRTLRISDSCV
jgi:hypothetical protein